MVLMWNALKTIYFFNCEAINLAKPFPIRCNLQRPNVIVANPSQVVPHQDTKRRLKGEKQVQSPCQKRSQLQIIVKGKKRPQKLKQKQKAIAAAGKNSKGKKKAAAAAATKGKAKAKAKAKSAAVKMTRKDVYSRAYHKAYQVCAKTTSKDVATAKSRE